MWGVACWVRLEGKGEGEGKKMGVLPSDWRRGQRQDCGLLAFGLTASLAGMLMTLYR